MSARVEVYAPRAEDVTVDADPDTGDIVLSLDEAVEVHLHPSGHDRADQLAWLDAVEAAVHRARRLMAEHPTSVPAAYPSPAGLASETAATGSGVT